MDIFINTLTGACFELRVSPFEPVFSIKCKLERLEDIPVCQQHLIWQNTELEDDKCLHDYGIKSGANLNLVLAMKNGLINTRKVVMEDPSLEGLDVYVDDSTKQEVLDRLMKDEQQVTFLVYREGDQLNFFRVQEKEVAESPFPDDDRCSPGKQMENIVTKDKMRLLLQQMAAKTTKKGDDEIEDSQPGCSKDPPRLTISEGSVTHYCPTPQKDSSLSQYMSNLHFTPSPCVGMEADEIPIADIQNKQPHLLPPISKGGKTKVNNSNALKKGSRSSSNQSCSSRASNSSITQKPYKKSVSSKFDKDIAQSSSKKSIYKKDFRKSSRIKRKQSKSEGGNASNPSLSTKASSKHYSFPGLNPSSSHKVYTHSSRERVTLPSINRDNQDTPGSTFDWMQESKKESFDKGMELRTLVSQSRHLPMLSGKAGNTSLPTINNKSNKIRCSWLSCKKKLGLATTYDCRCGSIFCPKHRYPEAHDCSYDYKTEGRKLLEQNNPVVRAQKLPKI